MAQFWKKIKYHGDSPYLLRKTTHVKPYKFPSSQIPVLKQVAIRTITKQVILN